MNRLDTRPYALAAVALTAGALVTATPVVTPPDVQVPAPAVQLTADGDLLNVPVNLFHDFVNISYNWIQAVQQMDDALEFSGNWYVPSVTNVWGWDDGDWYRALAGANMLVPFPALSEPLGHEIAAYGAAEFPTDMNCASVSCILNPLGIWAGFNQVPLQDLTSPDGYTFGTVENPVYPLGASDHLDPLSMQHMLWSDNTYTVDFTKPLTDFFESLTADPASNPMQLPTPEEIFNALGGMAKALFDSFNPFVPNSFLFDPTYWFPFDGPLNYPPDVDAVDAVQGLDAAFGL